MSGYFEGQVIPTASMTVFVVRLPKLSSSKEGWNQVTKLIRYINSLSKSGSRTQSFDNHPSPINMGGERFLQNIHEEKYKTLS